MEEQKKKINGLSEDALKSLQKEFLVIGKTRVKSWHAWLLIGVVAGAAAGIILVANRSGELAFGEAANKFAVKVLLPNGELFVQGKDNEIRWSGGRNKVSVALVNENINPERYPTGKDKGVIVGWISRDAKPDVSIKWSAKEVCNKKMQKCSAVFPGDYKILVEFGDAKKTGNWDVSDLPFKIVPPPTIKVLSPNGGETWQVGSKQTIKWATLLQSCVSCVAPPQGCRYEGSSCETCGALICENDGGGGNDGGDNGGGAGGASIIGQAPFPPEPPPGGGGGGSGGPNTVDLILLSYQSPCDKEPCPAFPSFAYTIIKGTPDDNELVWDIGSSIPAGQYVVRVQRSGTNDFDDSDAPFSIVAAPTASLIITAKQEHDKKVIAGARGFVFTNYVFDAANSGEDVRVTSVKLPFSQSFPITPAAPQPLTNCQIFDGTTALNTGSNIVNPTSESYAVYTFTLDNSLVVPRSGGVKSLTLRCNVPSNAAGGTIYAWGIDAANTNFVYGVISGNAFKPTVVSSKGPTVVVVSSGSLSVVLDAATPTARLVTAGLTNVPVTILRVDATNEAIRLEKLALQLEGSNPAALVKVTVWDGAIKVGEAVFPGDTDLATVTLYPPVPGAATGGVVIPKDGSKLLTLKADLANIGTGATPTASGVKGGDTVAVNHDANFRKTQGVGLTSGQVIYHPDGQDTKAYSVRIFKSTPLLTKLSVPSTTLTNSTGAVLYRFGVAADRMGDISAGKFTFKVATSTAGLLVSSLKVSNLRVFAYSDSSFSTQAYQSNPISKPVTLDANGFADVYFNTVGENAETIRIPDGSTRYFELRGDITDVEVLGLLSVQLIGDHGEAESLINTVSSFEKIESLVDNNFIWSGHSFGAPRLDFLDWTNGFLVPGLPSGGMKPNVFTPNVFTQ